MEVKLLRALVVNFRNNATHYCQVCVLQYMPDNHKGPLSLTIITVLVLVPYIPLIYSHTHIHLDDPVHFCRKLNCTLQSSRNNMAYRTDHYELLRCRRDCLPGLTWFPRTEITETNQGQ